MRKSVFLYIAAAATTAIAGIFHLSLGANSLGFNINNGILFVVGGIAQVFWIIPILSRWGKKWTYIGIGGTLVFFAIWAITRMPENPITGRGGGVNTMAILVESFQFAFVGLAIAIIIYERRIQRLEKNTITDSVKSKRGVLILTGIVVAIVLVAFFVPMFLNQGNGPPPRTGGP